MENMEAETIVKVDNVSMRFNLSKEKIDSMKEYFVKFMKHRITFDEFYALRHVNLEIKRGESLAIIGENGCGKSTLLKIISGIFYPTEGTVSVHGTIAPLIELGAGFDPDLTARENIYLNGALLGYSKSFMDARFQEIMDFAELWDFVDVPIKNYSSGMVARLGFSIATITTPDILIVDEILSVGDIAFQQKCEEKMNQMITEGATLIFVSHSTEQVRRMCKKAIWLKNGIPQLVGEVNEVCDAYLYDLENGRHGIVTLDDLEKQNLQKITDTDTETTADMTNNYSKKETINFIAFLRVPAVFLVLWDHLGSLWISSTPLQWSVLEFVNRYFMIPFAVTQSGGFLGVCLFFLISGFIITHVALRESCKSFLIKRFFRIFPVLMISTVVFYFFQLGIAALMKGETYWGQFGVIDWVSSALLLNSFIGANGTNGVTWTLIVEVLFYILCGIFIPLLKKSPSIFLLTMLTCCFGFIIGNNQGNFAWNQMMFSGSYIIYLVFGQILYLFWKRKIKFNYFISLNIAAYFILILDIMEFYPEYLVSNNSYIISFAYAYSIFALALLLNGKIHLTKGINWLANISYSVYLAHMTFGMLTLTIIYQIFEVSYTLMFLSAVIVVFIISNLQYQFVEKPFIKLGKKISQKIESR